MNHTYKDTNECLYQDIGLWEKTDGVEFMKGMPLNGNEKPQVLDFGFGFGEYLFAAAHAYPQGTIHGIDGNPICIKEVSAQMTQEGITNIDIIGESVHDLSHFKNESMDLVLLYDTLHANFAQKKMLLEESHRILKKGGCLSCLPFHRSNWRDADEKKKSYSIAKIESEIMLYGYDYAGTCKEPGIHWEKCHTLYYIQKGTMTISMLERMDVMNFLKV